MDAQAPVTFDQVKQQLHAMIGQFGLNPTYGILKEITDNPDKYTELTNNDQILFSWIIHCAKNIFGCNDEAFMYSRNGLYPRARFSCFYLLDKHTRMTVRYVQKQFDLRSHSAVSDGIKNTKELLINPITDKKWYELHMELEAEIDQLKRENYMQ